MSVPTFSNQPDAVAALWTGIGGATGADPGLVQDGIWLTGTSATIVYEYYGNLGSGATFDTSVAVNQGDNLFVECWVSDANGNEVNPPSDYATFYVLNETSWRETGTTLLAQFQTNPVG